MVSVVLREDTQLWGDFLLLSEVAVLVDQHSGGVCQKSYVSWQSNEEFCNAIDLILKIKNRNKKNPPAFFSISYFAVLGFDDDGFVIQQKEGKQSWVIG